MADVKKSIGLLCRHLNVLYNIELKPEHFRLAKFNKSEDKVVPIFWNLLTKLADEIRTSNVVKNTKLHLAKHNYESIEFFGLSESMSDGSRELLLALGFLICTGSLHNAVNHEIRHSAFDPTYTFETHLFTDVPEQLKLEDFTIRSEKDILNVRNWILGKIAFSERLMEDFQPQINKILARLSKDMPTLKDSYSMTELLALNVNEFGERFLMETERITNILRNHENFLKHEHIFWEWMESVIVERDKETTEIHAGDLQSFVSFAKKL